MHKIRLKDKEFARFISAGEITEAVGRVAREIKRDTEGANPLLVGMLNGAFMFAAALARRLNNACELTFARYASYSGTTTTNTLHAIMPLQADFKGRTLILIEDIIDTGFTMHCLLSQLQHGGAADIKIATLLLKPNALQYSVTPDYVGIEIPNDFVVGYGMDYDGLGRTLRDIYRLV